MRNYCLIFVTLFFASLLFKESTSCDGGIGCMCVTDPCPCQNRKITLNIDVEVPTPECKEGSPCMRGSDCGENGYCFSPSMFGTRYYYYLLCSTHYKSNMFFFVFLASVVVQKERCCHGPNPMRHNHQIFNFLIPCYL